MQLNPSPFYYLRHGQTDWNTGNLCIGQTDVSLNALGIAQAKAAEPLVRALDIGTIFFSPLERARVTALIVAGHSRLPLVPESDLQEVCLGIKEGQSENDPSDDFVSAWLSGSEIEGAEPFQQFRNRVVAAVNRSLVSAGNRPPLIVAHTAVFMATVSACGSRSDKIEHCRPYYFQPGETGWLIDRVEE